MVPRLFSLTRLLLFPIRASVGLIISGVLVNMHIIILQKLFNSTTQILHVAIYIDPILLYIYFLLPCHASYAFLEMVKLG